MASPLYLECACYYCRLMRVEYDSEFGDVVPAHFLSSAHTSQAYLEDTDGGEPFEDDLILNRREKPRAVCLRVPIT